MLISRKVFESKCNKLLALEQELKMLKDERDNLAYCLRTEKAAHESIKNSYDNLKEEKYEIISGCGVSVDFKKLEAVSIERNIHKNREVTQIYYRKKDSTLGEWVLFCNRDIHEGLVEEFNVQMG